MTEPNIIQVTPFPLPDAPPGTWPAIEAAALRVVAGEGRQSVTAPGGVVYEVWRVDKETGR